MFSQKNSLEIPDPVDFFVFVHLVIVSIIIIIIFLIIIIIQKNMCPKTTPWAWLFFGFQARQILTREKVPANKMIFDSTGNFGRGELSIRHGNLRGTNGVRHKNLVTWENRAPKDWQVAFVPWWCRVSPIF